MAHISKTFYAMHMESTQSEEFSRLILYSSIPCLRNHPNIQWSILHSLSRMIKSNIKWLRVLTTDTARKYRTRRDKPK